MKTEFINFKNGTCGKNENGNHTLYEWDEIPIGSVILTKIDSEIITEVKG